MICPLCASEEVYRGLNRRKRFWLWYLLLLLGGVYLPPLGVFAFLAIISIPFTEETVCRNCGYILA